MIEFINMKGFCIFIWPAYIIAFSLITYLYIASTLQLKKLEKEIEILEQKVAAEKIKSSTSPLSQTA